MHHPDPNEKSSQQRMVKKDAVMRRLLAATLSVSSLWQLMPLTATAQVTPLTAAGTTINNTATGTYVDPNNPGSPINTTSNTVTATVAEVAGVTNVPSGTTDINLGSVTVNDGLDYSFLITNVGNDSSAFHIPTTATIVGGSLGTTGASIPVVNQKAASIFVTAVNGVNLTTPVALPTSGLTSDTTFANAIKAQIPSFPGSTDPNTGSVPAGGSFKVVVPVTVTETIANRPVSVQLGDTGANDNSAGTQNQPDTAPLADVNEVYTVNVGAGTPVNGVREAAAKDTQILAVQINNLALATVLKTRTAYSPGPTTALTDDTLTYRLDLRVQDTTTIPNTSTAPLLPTSITLNGTANDRVLVSDAIPLDTVFDKTFATGALDGVAADGTIVIGGITWTRVYSTAATTIGPLALLADGQNWLTATDAALTAETATIRRIGYITNGPLPAGTTTTGNSTGLTFRVITAGIAPAGGTIRNIAQVFGQTTAGPISGTNPLVYDESGDQNPNNYEGTTPPTAITTPATSPNGIAALANGVDTNNDNTGGGTGGEDNIFTVNPSGIILNGPLDQPGAIGPGTAGATPNNTDFVNKSAIDVPAGDGITPVTVYNPAPIKFSNSVANPSSNSDKLDNVILEPISAAKAVAAVTGAVLTDYELAAANNGTDLKVGTTVTIAYPVGHASVNGAGAIVLTASGRTALYTYDGTNFSLTSSTTNGVADTTAPIKFTSLAVGEEQDYEVFVDLPAGSLVSTAYSVPIVSYVDSNPTTVGFKTVANEDNPFNIKIDRAYTGYLRLAKASRVLVGSGPALSVAGDAHLNSDPKSPAPGNILEYVITYTNLSTAQSGSGTNSILNANNIVITEDGAALTNNWGTTTTAVPSTAADPTLGAVITFFVGNTATLTTDTAVNKYIDTIPTLAPGGSGTLTFQRKVK